MGEEILEILIPAGIRGFRCSFQYDLFHVVVEVLLGITSKVLERVQVTLDQRVNVYVKGELGIPHSGVTENHGETIKFSVSSVDVEVTAIAPIDLGLNSWFCFVTVYCRNPDFRPYHPDIVFYDGIFSSKSLFLDLTINSRCSKGIFLKSLIDVVLITVQFAWFL